MVGGEDVLFRAVLRGRLQPESLVNCAVDLQFVMLLNEAIDIEDENNRRANASARQNNGG